MSEDQIGNIVAKAVWKWLQREKYMEYVPWVLNPASKLYDPAKSGRQQERDELLESLESCILQATNDAKLIRDSE